MDRAAWLRRGKGWLALAGAMLLLGVLGGCAATAVVSHVSTFGTWPADRKPGHYVFERLPSQQAQPEAQAKLEAAAEPALKARGFERAASPAQATLTVELGTQVRVEPRVRYDPFSYPYGWPHGAYAPYWRPGWAGGYWWGPGRGYAMSLSMDPPWVTLQVDLLIRDRRSGQVLYETHAAHDRVGAVDETVLPYVFEAALDGFPQPAPSPRVVTVPLPQADR